jgi:hypothetical protein
MSILNELDKEYRKLMNWMVKNPEETLRARKEFQDKVLKRRCFYGTTPFQITLMPLFLKEKSYRLLKDTTELMDHLIDRIVRLYFEDPYVHDYFPYWQIPKEWVEADPGYRKATVINRLDVLFDGKTLKFIEFNCDNPGGVGWNDVFEDIYSGHPLYSDIIKHYGIFKERSVVSGLHDAVKECFSDMGFPEPLRIALANFRDIGTHSETDIIRDFFLEKGIEANTIDPRDFELRKDGLWASGIHYPVVLRTLKAEFFMRYPRQLREFIKAVTGKSACMLNSFRATIGSQKTILSFMSNPLNYHYFSDKEIKYIKKYIPWTRRFDETITLSREGEEINLRTYVLSKREELVMKPSWGAGGYHVMVGKSTPEHTWKETFEEYQGDPTWVVQEYTEIPEIKIPVIKKNKIVIESKYFNLSPYCIGGKYVGVLGRTSDKDVINISAGGGILPVFPLKSEGEAHES